MAEAFFVAQRLPNLFRRIFAEGGFASAFVPLFTKTHESDGEKEALRFAEEELPDRYAEIQGFFRHRGAYARFKTLLAAAGCLEKWYAFQAESIERALKDWCAKNDIQVVEHDAN